MSDLVEKTIQTNHCVAIYISQVYKLQLFKRGIVHYISFSESKINILHLKFKTQCLGCHIQVRPMYGIERIHQQTK